MPQSYLILGAGVFGVSTAYHLIRKYPDADITLVDRDAYDASSRVAASWDWNKVVRADYDDIVYCQLALEAQDVFRSDPLWRPYFHETGIYWMCRTDYARDVIDNYRKLDRKADLEAVPVERAKQLYSGLFSDADYTGVKEVLVNKTSGWAAAGDCLRAVTARCLELGVRYVVADVRSVAVSASGVCTGLYASADGEGGGGGGGGGVRTLTADVTLLCTGAYTSKLLELSAVRHGRPELSADDRILAAGIATGMTRLSGPDLDRHRDMPVGMQNYRIETGMPFMGSLPPTPDGELKWWGKTIFSNVHDAVPGGKPLSAPPEAGDYAQWEVSRALKRDITDANRIFYGGKTAGWKMEKHRICWDAFTTSGDFIISPHSGVRGGLYVATCGNFHGWKFFPVIGKYVVQMLEGELKDEWATKWAWDRERPDPKHNPEYPRWEMKDFKDPVREARL